MLHVAILTDALDMQHKAPAGTFNYARKLVEGIATKGDCCLNILNREVLGSWVNKSILEFVKKNIPKNPVLMDLGCGDGSLTIKVANVLSVKDVWGVDIEDKALERAKDRGIKVIRSDLSNEGLNVSSNYFDVVTSFEVIEHLINPDNMLREAYRILKDDGILMVGTPNLASWISRIYLLFGYQPPDVDVSTEIKAGVFRLHRGKPSGHIRAFTLNALRDLLEYHGFKVSRCFGMHHTVYKLHPLLQILDQVAARIKPSLAHHLIVIAKK